MGKRRGSDYFAQIGSRGGPIREGKGPEFYRRIGRMAGGTTLDLLGIAHYERIGRMGGLRARRREREAQEGNQ
ncbi:MAG TPA: hypothetical protein VLB73_00680 [Patescibacteria group bacterium]|nr:hypothetical protein [Patescibacteria group bacterium]